MKYKVLYHKHLQRDLKKLEHKIISSFFEEINKISINPYCGTKLKGKYANLWKYRIGNFRIIYSIHNKELRILILRFKHRKDVYDNILF